MFASWGAQMALDEITLVLFTTLAPAGAFALVIMGVLVAVRKGASDDLRRIDTFMVIPLVVAMVGLIASATHLGNPANALYVFLGVGRSPLSNEVFSAVVFLGLSGVYWLYSFSEHPRLMLQRVWACALAVSGCAFITAIAFAYHEQTIISWATPLVPLAQWLVAVSGGSLLARATIALALPGEGASVLSRTLVVASGLSALAAALVFCVHFGFAGDMQNSLTSAAELVPFAPLMIAAFVAFSAAAVVLSALVAFRPSMRAAQGTVGMVVSFASCVLSLAGIFVMRFAFYMSHITVGLGV